MGWHRPGLAHWHAADEYGQDDRRRSWRETVVGGEVADATSGGDVAVAAAAPGRDGLRNPSFSLFSLFHESCVPVSAPFDSG